MGYANSVWYSDLSVIPLTTSVNEITPVMRHLQQEYCCQQPCIVGGVVFPGVHLVNYGKQK